MLTYEEIGTDGTLLVKWNKIPILGELYKEVDGFYYFDPNWNEGGGCIAAHFLLALADKLDELNKPWSKFIDENLKPAEESCTCWTEPGDSNCKKHAP